MPAIKVDPPPINMGIVDLNTGKPTRPFVEFMHRLWKRTGGEQDAIDLLDSTNAYPFFRPAGPQDVDAAESSIDLAVNNLAALVSAKAPETEMLEAIEYLRAVTLVDMARSRSETGELREQVRQLSKQVGSVDLNGVILPAQASS